MSEGNFSFLALHEPQLALVGGLAEKYWLDDANTALMKTRQFAELLAQNVAARTGLLLVPGESQLALLERLTREAVVPPEAARLFHEIRKSGNRANHNLEGDSAQALSELRSAWILSLWYWRTFFEPDHPVGAFVPPEPSLTAAELQRQLLDAEDAIRRQAEQVTQLLAERQAGGLQQIEQVVIAAGLAASRIELTEAQTRERIDEQLRMAGWETDSAALRYSKGTRPQKGRNMAIAEWPTQSGPADYVLFVGLQLVGVVEAKRKNKNAMNHLEQAKRYSRDFRLDTVPDLVYPDGPWGEYRVPFLYSTNGRAYLRQLQHESGIWFWDARRGSNVAKPLNGWHTPEGLLALLAQDLPAADEVLSQTPLKYDLALRPYQISAIQAAEQQIAVGQRELLLAMATGTGKTKTAITLIYRLLKARRFRRVLFLVDRTALGEQTAEDFKTTRLEGLRTFADTFGLKVLDDGPLEASVAVHVATVQSFARRLFPAQPGAPLPAVDSYDLIVVDEAHRGYTLDQDLSESELTWRSEDDYVSKYRRVLEHFDAVKVALTATPALHTTQIFGLPVFAYTYREAVLDGFLIDHEPPYLIETQLSAAGIHWKKGEQVLSYQPGADETQLYTVPDDVGIELEAFNRQVIAEGFNAAVCRQLAQVLDPESPEKTLIFCVTDRHADDVVRLLKEALREQYGGLDDDAVVKLTGSSDKPLQLIRRYRNEKWPNIAVTVDLLTTGIDVPHITNLVFLRRVGSRILFEQMLGRATRRADDIGKSVFRIYDAVRAYEALEQLTSMTPVVTQPQRSLADLLTELETAPDDAARRQLQGELVARLRRLSPRLTEAAHAQLEAATGLRTPAFIDTLRAQPSGAVPPWLRPVRDLLVQIESGRSRGGQLLLISAHQDEVISMVQAYPGGVRPEEYLSAFQRYIAEHQDRLPALTAVLTRPGNLTRADLRTLALELDQAGFSEATLQRAFAHTRQVDTAASIVGFIRAAAENEAPQAFEGRVDAALSRLLGSRAWTPPQRQWLERIAAQLKANKAVDTAMFDEPGSVFKQQGGLARLDRIFGGELPVILEGLQAAVWQAQA
ncbi:type I restriction-modification system endonuclease [Deinococcus rubellus]|uniref:type I restriction-modification system endonuclease n=1 Tax=Deinococcus rubellus TaxID=1889240 RepID=UPI0031EF19A0